MSNSPFFGSELGSERTKTPYSYPQRLAVGVRPYWAEVREHPFGIMAISIGRFWSGKRLRLVSLLSGAENVWNGLEKQHKALAAARPRAATSDSTQQHPPEGRPQYGLRGRTSRSGDVGARVGAADCCKSEIQIVLGFDSEAEATTSQNAIDLVGNNRDEYPLDNARILGVQCGTCCYFLLHGVGRW